MGVYPPPPPIQGPPRGEGVSKPEDPQGTFNSHSIVQMSPGSFRKIEPRLRSSPITQQKSIEGMCARAISGKEAEQAEIRSELSQLEKTVERMTQRNPNSPVIANKKARIEELKQRLEPQQENHASPSNENASGSSQAALPKPSSNSTPVPNPSSDGQNQATQSMAQPTTVVASDELAARSSASGAMQQALDTIRAQVAEQAGASVADAVNEHLKAVQGAVDSFLGMRVQGTADDKRTPSQAMGSML